MAKECFMQFEPVEIGSLPIGTVELSVPLFRNRIQIGAVGRPTFGRIVVETNDEHVTSVARSDGTPIQADVVESSAQVIDGRKRTTVHRSPVFVAPIPTLQFVPDMAPDGGTMWFAQAAGTEIRIADDRCFEELTRTLGYYAYAKVFGLGSVSEF